MGQRKATWQLYKIMTAAILGSFNVRLTDISPGWHDILCWESYRLEKSMKKRKNMRKGSLLPVDWYDVMEMRSKSVMSYTIRAWESSMWECQFSATLYYWDTSEAKDRATLTFSLRSLDRFLHHGFIKYPGQPTNWIFLFCLLFWFCYRVNAGFDIFSASFFRLPRPWPSESTSSGGSDLTDPLAVVLEWVYLLQQRWIFLGAKRIGISTGFEMLVCLFLRNVEFDAWYFRYRAVKIKEIVCIFIRVPFCVSYRGVEFAASAIFLSFLFVLTSLRGIICEAFCSMGYIVFFFQVFEYISGGFLICVLVCVVLSFWIRSFLTCPSLGGILCHCLRREDVSCFFFYSWLSCFCYFVTFVIFAPFSLSISLFPITVPGRLSDQFLSYYSIYHVTICNLAVFICLFSCSALFSLK